MAGGTIESAMPDKLKTYRSMRHFGRTREPKGGEAATGEGALRFVVQEHHATALHWDFRLERDGVLVSWAVPKGIPPDPKTNHLAVQTEDHPMEYLTFEGDIPEGSYGAGMVKVWDHGTYEAEKFDENEVMVRLDGERVRGKYVLFRTEGKNWMIHRMDPPQDPSRETMPSRVVPMLAKPGDLPRDDDKHAFEIKWDGVRAITYIQGGRVRAESRNLLDITKQYPEFVELGKAVGAMELVLDGEIVAFDDDGKPSFGRLQQRMGLTSESVIRRRMREFPVRYMIFDVLYMEGHATMALPYRDRRKLLEDLELRGPSWDTPSSHVGDGPVMLEAARAQGLEGLVAKRLDSPYYAGKRTSCWIKVKLQTAQEFVVAGWTPGEGSRSSSIGALLLGVYDISREEAEEQGKEQRLLYAGKVGTGFTEQFLSALLPRLKGMALEKTPFSAGSPPKGSKFIRPELVAQVDFTEWTSGGNVRHPSFQGLREDKDPRDVVRET